MNTPEEFAIRCTAGGELYYDYVGLKRLLIWCEQNAVPVLGLDGLKVQGEHLVPEGDAIADFSSCAVGCRTEQAAATLKAAYDFLRQVSYPENLLWCVVLSR